MFHPIINRASSLLVPRFDYHAAVGHSIARFLTAIQLTRLTMAFGAVSDVWFVVLATRAMEQDEAGRPRLLELP